MVQRSSCITHTLTYSLHTSSLLCIHGGAVPRRLVSQPPTVIVCPVLKDQLLGNILKKPLLAPPPSAPPQAANNEVKSERGGVFHYGGSFGVAPPWRVYSTKSRPCTATSRRPFSGSSGSSTTRKGKLDSPVFRIRIHLSPDPAKNLNPDPDPEDLESGSKLFLNNTVSEKKLKLECCKSHSKVSPWIRIQKIPESGS